MTKVFCNLFQSFLIAGFYSDSSLFRIKMTTEKVDPVAGCLGSSQSFSFKSLLYLYAVVCSLEVIFIVFQSEKTLRDHVLFFLRDQLGFKKKTQKQKRVSFWEERTAITIDCFMYASQVQIVHSHSEPLQIFYFILFIFIKRFILTIALYYYLC